MEYSPNPYNKKKLEIYLFDPYFQKYKKPPIKKYELTICTDVMEHVEEENITNVLNNKLVYDCNAYCGWKGAYYGTYNSWDLIEDNLSDQVLNENVQCDSFQNTKGRTDGNSYEEDFDCEFFEILTKNELFLLFHSSF